MARVLFTFAGGRGHVVPMLPLSAALSGAGHEVAVCGQASVVGGLSTFDEAFPHPTQASSRVGDAPGTGTLRRPDLSHEFAVIGRWFASTLAERNAVITARVIESWRPDLVVCDEMDFGSSVAAEAAGIPVVVVSVIASGALTRQAFVADALATLRSGHGLRPEWERRFGDLYVCPFPPSFRDPAFPAPDGTVFVRPDDPGSPGEQDRASAWFAAGSEPRIYLTLGTIFNTESGDLFARVLRALADLPVRVLATTGSDLDPGLIGEVGSNARVERYVPQSEVLPNASVVVNHGGSGSVIGALAHGVPVVAAPMGADQELNGARLLALDAGSVLDPVETSAIAIRETVMGALDPSAHRGARVGRAGRDRGPSAVDGNGQRRRISTPVGVGLVPATATIWAVCSAFETCPI